MNRYQTFFAGRVFLADSKSRIFKYSSDKLYFMIYELYRVTLFWSTLLFNFFWYTLLFFCYLTFGNYCYISFSLPSIPRIHPIECKSCDRELSQTFVLIAVTDSPSAEQPNMAERPLPAQQASFLLQAWW